ncbi:MAG: hypothetical protein R3Y53_10040 [Bacillota bacterium]
MELKCRGDLWSPESTIRRHCKSMRSRLLGAGDHRSPLRNTTKISGRGCAVVTQKQV